MKIKEKKKFLILAIFVIILAVIIAMIVLYNFSQTKKIEIASNEISTSNIGITTSEETNSWETSKLSEIIVDTSMTDSETGEKITMYVPIPAGYTASKATSEDTVIEGLVIYEGTEEVTDSNVVDAKTARNQYVWIPVDPEDVYWTDTDGSIYGIEYTFSSTGATGKKSTSEPYVGNNSWNRNSDYYFDRHNSDINSNLELLSDMQNNLKNVVNCIEIYGGFYISRYEVGDDNLTTRTESSGVKSTPVSMQGKYVYNYIKWYESYDLCKTLSSSNEKVSSCLIYGCLWDATLNFLVQSENKSYEEITDSSSWGNYYTVSFNYTDINGSETTKIASYEGTLIPTGSTEYTKSCNIYDLAGNVWEWTQESFSDSSLTWYNRGGGYDNGTISKIYPSSYRRIFLWRSNKFESKYWM